MDGKVVFCDWDKTKKRLGASRGRVDRNYSRRKARRTLNSRNIQQNKKQRRYEQLDERSRHDLVTGNNYVQNAHYKRKPWDEDFGKNTRAAPAKPILMGYRASFDYSLLSNLQERCVLHNEWMHPHPIPSFPPNAMHAAKFQFGSTQLLCTHPRSSLRALVWYISRDEHSRETRHVSTTADALIEVIHRERDTTVIA